MTYCRPPIRHLGGGVPPVPRGIYATAGDRYNSAAATAQPVIPYHQRKMHAKETAHMLLSGRISVPQNSSFSNACKISADIAVKL